MRWVIIASERAKRPHDFKRLEQDTHRSGPCPFCEGSEGSTPPEILALRSSNSGKNKPGWRVRVVPNKFPALMIEGDLDKRGEGMYDLMNGIGAHEVIIEHPKHLTSITALTVDHIRDVLWAYKARLLDLKNDKRMVYGLIFKNVGDRAGASLEHTHSQLIITPIVPLRVQSEIDRCVNYYDFRGRCLFCDMVKQEIGDGVRVIAEGKDFVAFEPFAPRFPFETWIVPTHHNSHFEATEDWMLGDLASILRRVLKKIEGVVQNPPYNYLIHTSPLTQSPLEHYHWHIEIIPRITRVAGFEWGTGFYINPVPPEDAARYMREIKD
jgi:UDPglucose--hexose-1-phosphate uridylyltransferase